jgi:hypothetical protein
MPKVREPGVYRPRFRDKATGEWRKSAVWWINWTDARGVRHRESSGSEQQEEAVRIRRAKLHAVDQGQPSESDIQRTSFDDLARLIETDYTNEKRSLRRLRGSIVHLSRAFKGMPAVKIDEERIDRYVAERKAQEAANGTINRELTTLKRAFGWRRSSSAWQQSQRSRCSQRPRHDRGSSSRRTSHCCCLTSRPTYEPLWRLPTSPAGGSLRRSSRGSGSTSTSRPAGFGWSPERPRTATAACFP